MKSRERISPYKARDTVNDKGRKGWREKEMGGTKDREGGRA